MPGVTAGSAASGTSGMLSTRILTALVMVAVGLSALFALPAGGFSLFAIVVLVAPGSWEAARMAGLDAKTAQAAFTVLVTGVTLAAWAHFDRLPIAGVLMVACAAWLLAFCWLSRPALGRQAGRLVRAGKLALLGVVLFSTWFALSWLQAASPWYVFMLLMLIAAADTFAFFTGRHFGGARLAPRISPGKTRSGAIGGLAGAAALTALAAVILPETPFSAAFAAGLGLIVGMISIGGDLFISLLKRQVDLKDTSRLLPGHGGILDRFDSLAAAVPFFSLAVLFHGA